MPGAIDRTAMRNMRSELGDDVFLEIAEAYFTSGDELIASLGGAVAAGEYENAAKAAHSLKSSSAMLGGAALADECGAFEDAFRAGTPAKLPALASKIEKLHAAFRTALEKETA